MRVTILSFFLLGQFAGIANTPEQQVDLLDQKCHQYLRTNLDSAMILAMEAEKMASEVGYDLGKANALYIQGYAHYIQGKDTKALINYLEAGNILKQLDKANYIKTEVELLLSCGIILFNHHKYQQAISFYQEALTLTEESSSLIELSGEVYFNMGMAYRHIGDLNQSTTYILKSLNIAKTLQDENLINSRWNQLGLIYKDNHDYHAAREVYQKIVSNDFKELNPSEHLGRAHHNIAFTFYKEQNYDSAIYHYQKALAFKKETNIPRDIYITLLDLTELHLNTGDPQRAKETGLQAYALYDKIRFSKDHFKLFSLLSKTYYVLQDYEAAAYHSNKYVEESNQFYETQSEVLKLKEQYEIDQVMTSFYKEQKQIKKISSLEKSIFFTGITALATVLLVVLMNWGRKRLLRKSLEREIRSIESSSFM